MKPQEIRGLWLGLLGVTIFGLLNLPATLPVHASQMYARVIQNFLGLLIQDGAVAHVRFNGRSFDVPIDVPDEWLTRLARTRS